MPSQRFAGDTSGFVCQGPPQEITFRTQQSAVCMIQMAARPLPSGALVTFRSCCCCQLGLVRMLERSLGALQMPIPGLQLPRRPLGWH